MSDCVTDLRVINKFSLCFMNYKPDMLTTFQIDKILKCFVVFNIQCSIFTLLNICSEESNCDNMFFFI